MDWPAAVATIGAAPKLTSQVVDLAAALALTAVIGLERQLREKSAGLRTHAVIGLGAALFVLLSKYGFADVLAAQRIVLDPSRVAAQIASGIGFVGAGLIFIRRDAVKGLTTAATVWLTAAIGAAAGAGLVSAAALATAGYLVIAIGLRLVEHRLPDRRSRRLELVVGYRSGHDTLRQVLDVCSARGYAVLSAAGDMVDKTDEHSSSGERVVRLHLHGEEPPTTLVTLVSDLSGVDTTSVVRE